MSTLALAMSRFKVAAALVAICFAVGASAAIGPKTDLYIVNGNVAPQGVERQAVLVGATPEQAKTPGPVIKGNKGDNFQINVINMLTNITMLTSTTVHWHGIFQRGNNYADGTAFVTQCPVMSGNSFLYDFNVLEQAGTYWYHSHEGEQYCDGLRGPLIVYDPDDPHGYLYDVDDDNTIITLSDWFNIPAMQLPHEPHASNASLINGLARHANGSGSLSVITVKQGLRYRIRLISMSCESAFNFTIDNHDMTIIEADGQNTQPLQVDALDIYAGQRYSFVLNANQPVDNYWIKTCDLTYNGPFGLAILRYEGAPKENPQTIRTTTVNPLFEYNLRPFTALAAPGKPNIDGADISINLEFTYNISGDYFFYVNGVSYTSPPIPVLLQILSETKYPSEVLPAGSVYNLPRNRSVQISMPGGSAGGPHPMHLHGHVFSVIRSAGQNESQVNYVNPILRDTVSMGNAGDNVTIRLNTNNPGSWFLHCHIDFHLFTGMAIVLDEERPEVPPTENPTAAWYELCPDYYAL